MPRKPAQFGWDSEARRYRYASGRAVPSATVEKWIAQATQAAEDRIGALTQSLVDGRMDVFDWKLAMKDELKHGHRAMAMIAAGGKDQMTPAAWGRVGSVIRGQYKFLDNFARQLEAGDVEITPGIIARARMYGAALYPGYISGVKAREALAGATQERSLITPGENCGLCISEAARGWVPMGQLIPVGARTCLVRCRCAYETR